MNVNENILQDEKYKYLFSVEEVNKLVLQGIPFRDAYKKIGMDIEEKYDLNKDKEGFGEEGEDVDSEDSEDADTYTDEGEDEY
jgi:argininosuccinate lyase